MHSNEVMQPVLSEFLVQMIGGSFTMIDNIYAHKLKQSDTTSTQWDA